MKKINKLLTASLILCGAFIFSACESTDVNEEVTSSVSEKHITVDQTKSTVRITLKKEANEEIDYIDVIDMESGALAHSPMTTSPVTFVWPFAEKDKEYTLCAQINGKNYSEEFVTFKVTGDVTSDIKESKKFDEADIILIAKGNERLVKFETTKSDFTSILKKVPSDAQFTLQIYSGLHFKAKPSDSTLVAQIRKPASDSALFKELMDGYDIIAKSAYFSLSKRKMNSLLSAGKTYFAAARILYAPKGDNYPDGFKFGSPALYSNDTIYTPIDESELPEDTADDANAK